MLPASLTVPEHAVKLEILARASSGACLISLTRKFKWEMTPIRGTLSSGQLTKGRNILTGDGKGSPDVALDTTIRTFQDYLKAPCIISTKNPDWGKHIVCSKERDIVVSEETNATVAWKLGELNEVARRDDVQAGK